jgi:hypothetical protein
MSKTILSSSSQSSQAKSGLYPQAQPDKVEQFSSAPAVESTGLESPLVLTSINQTRAIDRGLAGIIFYKNSIKVLRKAPMGKSKSQPTYRWEIRLAEFKSQDESPKRGRIDMFSMKSKARLQHLVQNADANFCSQMTLTYDGDSAPSDGLALKADLNIYLTRLRKEFPDMKYLWVLEFQGNGNPHFHVFTTIQYSPGYARFLGYLWNVTVKGSAKHLRVHQYVPNHQYNRPVRKGERHGAFCPWDMGDGSYLTYKYLSKASQKSVPPEFSNVGRFWGATRKLVKAVRTIREDEFYSLFEDTLNTTTGEIVKAQQHINRFFRDLRNYHEKRVNSARRINYDKQMQDITGTWGLSKFKVFKSPIRRCCDALIPKGVTFYEQWFEYYQREFRIPF